MSNQGEQYDLIAADFAKLRSEFNTEKKYLDLLISYLTPPAKILDVGCGSGFPIAAYLMEQGFTVVGVDGSKELLKIAQKNYPAMECIYGDVRTVNITERYDAVVEWWCLFHVPSEDHGAVIARFASWLKKGGILEFTTGAAAYEGKDNGMLNQELSFYSLDPQIYEKYLYQYGFKILLREADQDQHLVWIAQLDTIVR
jgi:2-polyprenyl-3-methyl-5-hydroxy-6-metoxy-1,4-benzoquinol methylase